MTLATRMKEYEEMLLNADDVGKTFDDKLSTIEESASLECQVLGLRRAGMDRFSWDCRG